MRDLIRRVCLRRGVLMNDVLAGAKHRPAVDARAEIVFRAGAEIGLAGVTIARDLGVSKACVSQARARGMALIGSATGASRQGRVNP